MNNKRFFFTIDVIFLLINTLNLYDELISHRVGLLIFNFDFRCIVESFDWKFFDFSEIYLVISIRNSLVFSLSIYLITAFLVVYSRKYGARKFIN